MKVFAIIICRWPLKGPGAPEKPVIVASGYDLSSFSFFQRNSVKEWAVFFTKTLVKGTQPGVRQTVIQEDYGCHVQVRHDGISGIVITDKEYPPRTAFSCLQALLEEFCSQFRASWENMIAPGAKQMDFARLDEYLVKYQNPMTPKVDKVEQIMKDIDETKIIMHQNIQAALANGQKLDDLVDKSEDLSRAAKVFYKKAKEANKCCRYV